MKRKKKKIKVKVKHLPDAIYREALVHGFKSILNKQQHRQALANEIRAIAEAIIKLMEERDA